MADRRSLLSRIPRGAAMLSSIAIVNVVLGFAREGLIAYYFGTSADLDAFLVAYTVPRVIVMQAVQITVSIILPLYVARIEEGRPEEATALLRRWFLFLAKVMTGFCVAVGLAAPVIMYLISPGLSSAKHHDAARWLRWLLPYVWLITLSGCFKVVLDHNRRFFMPAMSSAFVSAGVMIACVAGAASGGVSAMLPGYLAGGAIAFVFQWRQAHRYEPELMKWKKSDLAAELPLIGGGIMVLNSFAQQAYVIIDRGFASSLPAGSIAALNYANAILAVPQNIISMAVATALFPVLSEMIARGQWRAAFRTTVTWTAVILAMCLIPVAGMAIWRHQLVALVFQRGQFGKTATDMTAAVLFVLAFMLLVSSANVLVLRLLLAQQQLRWILLCTILAVALKVGANLLLVRSYGLTGVAISTVFALGVATVGLYIVAARYAPARQGAAA